MKDSDYVFKFHLRSSPQQFKLQQKHEGILNILWQSPRNLAQSYH